MLTPRLDGSMTRRSTSRAGLSARRTTPGSIFEGKAGRATPGSVVREGKAGRKRGGRSDAQESKRRRDVATPAPAAEGAASSSTLPATITDDLLNL